MTDRRAFRFRVDGRVQGVSFRWSAVRAAEDAGVTGWIANRPDGAVEGHACGSESALAAFARWLEHGPRHARVEAVDIAPAPAGEFTGFTIR